MNTAPCTIERVWVSYLLCVSAVALFASGAGEGYEPATFLMLHAAVFLGVAVCAVAARLRGVDAARWPRVVLALIGLPVVFSALGMLLPHVHPEPYEYTWLELDRAVFGDDCVVWVGQLPVWLVELLQWVYASFYCLCIVAVLLAGVCSGRAALDRAVLLVVGGFLASYLGYLLVPTLPPKAVLEQLPELRSFWLAASLREWIDGAEMNHWDCFPSGHTMMTVTSLIVLWRWARRWFAVLLVPALLLIASTVLLHYHWCADVFCGALLAWPCAWLCDRLGDRDGMAPAAPQASRK